jgi:arylsulfatase
MQVRQFNFFPAAIFMTMTMFLFGCGQPQLATETNPQAKSGFNGEIKLDIRDSKSDWAPYTHKKAPEGAPNILFILYDDTGLAAWSPY